MGAPLLLGGAYFEIISSSIPLGGVLPNGKVLRTDVAYSIASSITVELRNRGCNVTRLKRGKPDDARFRCLFANSYIDVILIAQECGEESWRFYLDAWGFRKNSADLTYQELRESWQGLLQTLDLIITERFRVEVVRRLSADEVNARYEHGGAVHPNG
jgi:hypothetical protein